MMFLSKCSTVFRHGKRNQPKRACALLALLAGIGLTGGNALTTAAELTIADGVVVKFGQDAQLVVRDRIVAGSNVAFTSQKDDSVGGQTGTAAGTPAAGDWRGIRLEKSAVVAAPGFKETNIRYAGSSNEAALLIRGASPVLQYFQVMDSLTGLRLQGASPAITGSSFLRNGIAIEADGSSAPVIGSTQFSSNTTQAILNKTPATVIQATGNWWGHASGPKDVVGNPQGQGDVVSAGVNYGSYLTAAPLLSPSIRLVSPASYYEQRTLALEVSCVNATEYRIAEGDAFAGVTFQQLSNGKAQVSYTASEGDGRKNINVQFRNASGTVVTASLTGGAQIDTQAPIVSITNPAAGSVINQSITIETSASDASGIAKVEIWLDNQLVATKTAAPYNYVWDTTATVDGTHELKAIATDAVGRSSQQTLSFTFSRVIPPADTEGPQLTNIALGGTALANGMTLSRSGTVTLAASDRSGIARIELLFDNAVVGTASGSGSYTVALNLDNVANGAHTLALRAVDSLGNISTSSYTVTVTHAMPNVPIISTPASGLVTRTAALSVSGTAPAGSSVQLINNGQPAGPAITAGSGGSFTGNLTLVAGQNSLQATATDTFGTSTASSPVVVTLDVSVPGSPTALTASSLGQGKIRLSWTRPSDVNVVGYDLFRSNAAFATPGEAVKINGSRLTVTSYDDMPPSDGTWYYRVVAVNAAGTYSEPGNLAQIVADANAPKALSIAYQSQGKFDAATGRYGQGRINVTLTVSEALPALPYLSIVPAGGTPLVVELVKSTDTVYTGSFNIDANTPSGTANAIFSARDAVGNRGTDILAGATLKIDTEGPAITGIVLDPTAPIKNDPVKTITATFTLGKAVKAGSTPQISWLLSGPIRQPVALTGLAAVNATTWRASFTLPSDAGMASPETLSFLHQAIDDLDNQSTKVSGLNRFQVYQGQLPPLGIPTALVGRALSGGKVLLTWQGVDEASTYQVYRQGPGETQLQALARSVLINFTDQTPADGKYQYAVASVRQINGQESLSGQSNTVEVQTSATAPGAPQNLALELIPQGIKVSWQAPPSSTVASYNLYRAGGTSLSSIEGLTPYKTGIKLVPTLDPAPSSSQGTYVVTALDAAGNESAPSNSSYLNASLLPVSNLVVEQIGNALPVITWNAPNGNVAGYNVYLGPDNAKIKLTPSPITSLTFTDTGYTSGERRYAVATVDTQSVELARPILLPAVSAQIVGGLPIKRGVMNKLQVQVSNTSAVTLAGLRVTVRLPINAESTQYKTHNSESISLGANETRLLNVVVGGYATLPSRANAQVGVEIAPQEGERVRITRDQTVDVGDGSLVVGMATEEFTRGGTGKVRLTIENTGEIDLELLTAIGNGASPSSELRFKLIDGDGNVLSTQPYKQAFGANVVTLTNGLTVARIPAGASYVSEQFAVAVPAASPNSLKVRLEVDKIRYHSGQEDEVIITGRSTEKTVSLADTAYTGEVTQVGPISSFGDQDIVISGRAFDRSTQAALSGTRLKLVLNQQGFERALEVVTDAAGSFSYTFKPTLSDAGTYKVCAIHPDITDRPEQKAFTINRVTVGPNPYSLTVPRNYAFAVPFVVKAAVGTSASNLRLVTTAPLPAGVNLQISGPVNISERQTINIPVTFTADNAAPAGGSLTLDVMADEHPQGPLAQIKLNYTLTEAQPYLTATPSFIETGLARGGSQMETLLLENKGLQDALNLRFSLTQADGVTPAPAWASLSSQPNGTLAIGQKRNIDINFSPAADVAEGVYNFKLKVEGDNVPAQSLNVYASITQSGQGNVLFKASDIYTGTVDKEGRLVPGLAGSTVRVQNEDVASVVQELVTDSLGEAWFQNLPAGNYQFRARATNHQEVAGRFQVKPGITLNQPIFLDYNLVQIEWSVREITIQDRYEITLNATYETDVPAAVLVMQPGAVNLPKMNAGDVFYGEFTLQNYGLIRADNLKTTLPADDEFFKYEFLMSIPPSLAAKQRVTIPYRITALKSLDQSGTASGGGTCYSYSTQIRVGGSYYCANGQISYCGAGSYVISASGSSCTGGGGIGGGGIGGIGGGGIGGGGTSYGTLLGTPPCTKCEAVCCPKDGGAGTKGGAN